MGAPARHSASSAYEAGTTHTRGETPPAIACGDPTLTRCRTAFLSHRCLLIARSFSPLPITYLQVSAARCHRWALCMRRPPAPPAGLPPCHALPTPCPSRHSMRSTIHRIITSPTAWCPPRHRRSTLRSSRASIRLLEQMLKRT